ncbi:MAG: PAS domain S-box protein [Deltaproteobacteria bacterium]|nr:PAS domain S-box protein [Deltaproteobacteria bacterium]
MTGVLVSMVSLAAEAGVTLSRHLRRNEIIKYRAIPSKYGIAVLFISMLPVIYFISRQNYNLFHGLVDGVTIVIAASAFTIIWTSRRLVDNCYFLYVGIAFLFFAILDLMHLLGNKGMGMLPEYGNLGPAFYIASRYVLSLSLLIAPLFATRRLNTSVMYAVYSGMTLLIFLSIFYWKIFPVCIIEGVGLTPFKVVSDYVICLILLGSIGTLLAHREAFDSRVLWLIVFSLILSVATGLAFSLYTDPFGISNMIGHVFQIGSFYLIYLAFIETSLTKPQKILYRKLKQNEEKLTENVRQLDDVNAELNKEVAERRRAEEAIRESRAKLQAALASMTDAVFISDALGQFVEFNDAFASFYRFRSKDECARTFAEFPDILDVFMADGSPAPVDMWALPRALRGETVANAEYALRRKDTGEIWVGSYSFSPIRDKGGIIAGAVVVVRDITDIKKAAEALNRQAAKLEAANQELESFAYSVSHDLRAPLRAIDGYSRMILKRQADKFDPETERQFNVIRENVGNMNKLIEDLLAFSRLGRQAMSQSNVKMEEVCREVWEELKEANQGRSLDFKMNPLPPIVGDPALIKQVFKNLLENAVKFTRMRDTARIEAGSYAGENEMIYWVRDNGIGFDMRYYNKLFSVFQRLHGPDDYEGTGIGLSIVSRIIVRHGGRVWAQAKENEGATFYFSFPLDLRKDTAVS